MSNQEIAQNLLNTAAATFGGKASGDYKITKETAEGLVNYLEDLQKRYSALAAQNSFSPYVFDARARNFVAKIVEQNSEDSAKATTALNVLTIMGQGKLPNGTYYIKPPVEMPWARPRPASMFFNEAVYHELNDKNSVSHKNLFHPANADPTQQKLIEMAAKKIKLMPMNPESKHPEEFRYSGDSVKQLATEIMALQAKSICNITNEKDITNAIMSFRYMPSLRDMQLAEEGFGKPTWDANRMKYLESTGIKPHDLYFTAQTTSHQSQKWGERFGKIDTAAVDIIAKMKAPGKNPDTVITQDETGKQETVRDMIARTHQSPHSFYGLPFHRGNSQIYNSVRENIYLPRFNFMMYKGLDLCSADPNLQQHLAGSRPAAPQAQATGGPSAPAAAPVPASPTPAPAPSGTGAKEPCFANGNGCNGRPLPPPVTPQAAICFANSDSCSAKVIRNTMDATGQPNADAPICFANGNGCMKPAAEARPQ